MLDSLYNVPKRIEIFFDKHLTKVVDDYEDEVLTPNQKILLNYFQKKQGAKSLFSRADFNPAELKSFLPQISIIKPLVDDKGVVEDVHFKLMGTEIADFYGEITGESIKDHFSPILTERVFGCVSMVLNSASPLVVYNANSEDQPCNNIQTHTLYFPISENGETINKIILYTEVSKISGFIF